MIGTDLRALLLVTNITRLWQRSEEQITFKRILALEEFNPSCQEIINESGTTSARDKQILCVG
jgi:hypothetical protein